MNILSPVLEATWAERVGWTLVHSAWQVALMTPAYAVVSFLLRRGSANLRYVLGCFALVAMIALPAATWVHMSIEESAENLPAVVHAPIEVALGRAVTEAMPSKVFASPPIDAPQPTELLLNNQLQFGELVSKQLSWWHRRLEPALPWIASCWLIGVLLLALRPLWGLWIVQRLRTRGLTPLSTELRELADRVMERLRVTKAVQFSGSALVEVPTIVGYLRPMVLLPASAVTGLSTELIELIFAHELAHVRRHDYLVNFVQTVIEALLFYHPGMWWVSAQVRRERENCCDDVAMSVCSSRGEYIRALYALESQRQSTAPALAASGGSLVRRVRRLAPSQQPATRLDRTKPWLAGLVVLSVVAVILTFGQLHAEDSLSASSEAAEAEATATEKRENAAEALGPTTLTGRILYDGTPPKPKRLQIPLTRSYWNGEQWVETPEIPERRRIHDLGLSDESLIVGEDGGIANVIVWVRSKDVPINWSGPLPPSTIRATLGRFEPHVLAFWNAAPLVWINETDEGVTFDWSQARSDARKMLLAAGQERRIELSRSQPIPIRLKSNLQPWMSAYVLPVAHPYFAVTDRDGQFKIKDLPPGEWEFAIWHERAGWLETDRFPTGRFMLAIEQGENALGELRVDPQTVAERNQQAANEQEAKPQNVEQPLEQDAEQSIKAEDVPAVDTLPPLLTLRAAGDKTLVLRQIDKALEEVKRRGEGHVIVGRVQVEGDDNPTHVNAQMEILGGGFFAGPTRDLERPVGFRMHGYAPYDLKLVGRKGKVVDVGTIQMKRLSKEETVPVVGRVVLEGDGDLSGVAVRFSIEEGPVNTPSGGTAPRLDRPDPIEVELDSAGRFYQTGFSPAEYHMIVTAPGYVKQSRRVHFPPGGILNLETIRLEKPWRIEVDYIATRELPFQLEQTKHTVLEGGARWQITPHRYRHDLEFKQQNHELSFAWSYGPIMMADLGAGELSDYLTIDGSAAVHPPNLVALANDHVYLVRRPDWESEGDNYALLKLHIDGYQTQAPAKGPGTDGRVGVQHAEPTPRGQRAAATRPQQPPTAKPSPIDELDREGFSQLHRAATGGHVERVRQLLADGANVDAQQGTYHGTPLQYAAYRDHVDTVQVLLEHGATVDARDTYGRTPLIWAAMGGRADIIRRLLDGGANVNVAARGGWTPLHYAVDKGHVEAAQLLIDRGADIHAKDSRGKTPVDLNPKLNLRIPWEALRRPSTSNRPPSSPTNTVPPASPQREKPAVPKQESAQSPIDVDIRSSTDVIAEVRGKPILWRDIAPTAEWYEQRDEYERKHGHTRGYASPDDYAQNRLNELIWKPLLAKYRKENDVEPSDQEIDEFIIHDRRARKRQNQETAQKLEQLQEQIEKDRQQLNSPNLTEQSRRNLERKISIQKREVEALRTLQVSMARRKKQGAEYERFFAQWYVGNWKLQQSLYKKYGGRAIWQQVGPEAIDAMRDLLKERQADGYFAIHDAELHERFWEPFLREKLSFQIPNPERVFEHPWSSLENPSDNNGGHDK